ncbi:MAG: HAMP domain-containing protein [Spirochaetia bacterium]|nr:HAMP domain-containing protein [Spirochaetia bacterium]
MSIGTILSKTKSLLGINESRIKKKLMIYFILISFASISISLEVILEVSEGQFRQKISKSYIKALKQQIDIPESFDPSKLNMNEAFQPLNELRVRMLLLFLVIVVTIGIAFSLFSKDIATPIDSLVEGAKKVADGDLTYTLQIHREDEIGQLAKLINDMNANLQELVVEIRFEMNRFMRIVGDMEETLQSALHDDIVAMALDNKKIGISQIKKLQSTSNDIQSRLKLLKEDLSALSMLIDMYKVYQVSTNHHSEVV